MKKTLFSLLFSVIALTTTQARQPNVILIYTDDQGTIDVNCYGAKDLTTPHMDGLAKQGVKFKQFYSAAPVCSPSRAAVLTGRYPQRAQIPGNVSSHKGHAGMPAHQITMAETFKARTKDQRVLQQYLYTCIPIAPSRSALGAHHRQGIHLRRAVLALKLDRPARLLLWRKQASLQMLRIRSSSVMT